MTTNIAKEKLKSLLDCAVQVASLYKTGYTTLHRCNEITVTFVKDQAPCDGTTTVNAVLLANAFIYSLMRQCSKECHMIGHTGSVYPGKGLAKTYFLLARRQRSAALLQDVDELNTMAAVYTEYPPVSLCYAMHKKFIPHYLAACKDTKTAVFDKETGAYVSRSRNKVINLIADLFNKTFSAKEGEYIGYSDKALDDIIAEVSKGSTTEAEEPAEEKEKPVKETEKPAAETKTPKKAKSKKAPATKEEVVTAVEEVIASPDKQPEEEEKTYGLTEEEFISVFLSLEEEGKERWAEKLRPVLEAKKQPFIEQMKQLAQLQLDLEAQAKLVAEKVASIDKVINRMASFFNA